MQSVAILRVANVDLSVLAIHATVNSLFRKSKSSMVKILTVIVLLLLACILEANCALACNCGCQGNNCGAAQQQKVENSKEEKLVCEAPKDWILAYKENNKTKNNTNHLCDGNCKK